MDPDYNPPSAGLFPVPPAPSGANELGYCHDFDYRSVALENAIALSDISTPSAKSVVTSARVFEEYLRNG